MSLEHTTRAITENKFNMQLFADKKSLEADIAMMKKLKESNPKDERASDYAIKQKEYELSQIEGRIKGKDYSSVKTQCEQYFADNSTLFDKNTIISETRTMLSRGQMVNEWPHLAAVFLLDHAAVTGNTQQQLQAMVPPPAIPPKVDPVVPQDSLNPGEAVVPPSKQPGKPASATPGEPKNPIAVTGAVSQPKSSPSVSSRTNTNAVAADPKKSLKSNNESNNKSLESVKKAYDDFIAYAQQSDKWFAGIRNSKEDIQQNQRILSEKFSEFDSVVKRYIQAGGKPEDINWMRLNIAYYYTDDLSGISSKNQMNIVRSMDVSLDVLGDKIPRAPSTIEQLAAVADRIKIKNPQLADLIGKRIAEQGANPDLSAILSSPMVKGGWENASDEIYGEYLKQLDDELDRLKGQKWNTLTESQRKALDHLRDIRGKNGLFDFTVQNREQMWTMIKSGAAIGAGILATIPTGGGSLGALALGAGIGATVATTGGILAQGYHGSAIDIAGEAGINLLSFGGGAILFKIASGARIANFAAKNIGAAGLVYGLEGGGNIGIGVGTDMLRARLHGEDLDVWSSIQQNLVWAALPFVLRMRGVRVPQEQLRDATQVDNLVQAAVVQSSLGNSPRSLLEKMKAPLSRLKSAGEKGKVVSSDASPMEAFKNMHLSGDALYEKAIKAGRNHVQIEGLPPGYRIGTTVKGDKIQILTPKGGTINIFKDELADRLIKIFDNPVIVKIEDFTTRKISTKDVRALGETGISKFPQFLNSDGSIWTIRSITGKKPNEFVEIGPLGQPSVSKKVSIKEFVDSVNTAIDKFKNGIMRNHNGTYRVSNESLLKITQENGYDVAKVIDVQGSEFFIRRKIGDKRDWERFEPVTPTQKASEKPTQAGKVTSAEEVSGVKNNPTKSEKDASHSTKPKYEWKWKNIDTVLQGDNRKFRQIFPFADNNMWEGLGQLTKGEMSFRQALQNSLAWTQNQTFSQIYREMTKPWRANPSGFVKNSVDNIRTLLLSGESGKWISKDRLGKLGMVMSASAIDYVNSDKYTQEGLFNAVKDGIGYTFNKYVLNPSETLKLFQEIIIWNWVAILAKESSSFIGAGTGIVNSTISTVTDRLQ